LQPKKKSPPVAEVRTFQYEIEGVKYTQKPLVLGQLEDLTKALEGTSLGSSEGVSEDSLKDSLLELLRNGSLSKALAVALIPEGVSLREKNTEELVEILRWSLDLQTGIRIISDFFTCNVPAEVLSSLRAATSTPTKTK